MLYRLVLLSALSAMLSACAADKPMGLCTELGLCSDKSCSELKDTDDDTADCALERGETTPDHSGDTMHGGAAHDSSSGHDSGSGGGDSN